jgi:hypothetical protein
MKPHRNADVIKAFADGKDCEFLGNITKKWLPISNFRDFDTYGVTRIKPEPIEDIYLFATVYMYEVGNGAYVSNATENLLPKNNLKLIFDGETREIIFAEVIK